MRIAICDDSLFDRQLVSDLLCEYFTKNPVSNEIIQYSNGSEMLLDYEEEESFDVAFLDIYMNGILGIDVARKLRQMGYDGHIVFLSASPEYAVDSYDVEATAYLLKPHSYEKLVQVMDKITRGKNANVYQLQQHSKIIRVPYHEILYVESSNSKCILHRAGGQTYTVYKRLTDIEEELKDDRFLRCHRSYLINMDYIQQIEDHFLLTTGDIVLIRQRNLKNIRQMALDYIESKK